MTESRQDNFTLSDYEVFPAEGLLTRGEQSIRLEPLVMDVLVYFASRAGEVITREDLERDVWRGALVGYDAVTATVIKLRKALGDDARNPRYIATIPKKGYQLIAPVSAAHRSDDIDMATLPPPVMEKPSRSLLQTMLFAIISGLVIVAVISTLDRDETASTDSKPTIVVLPLKNLSADPGQDYFSEGITDDLITDLARVETLHVIARQSAKYYQDNPAELDKLAQQVNSLYLVSGSVQQADGRVRVNVQLVDHAKPENLWAERFDTDNSNLFEVQDKITRQVIDAIPFGLPASQQPEPRSTRSFDAYDMFLTGQQHAKSRSKQGFEAAMSAYRKAIEIDPEYARAYGGMAVALTRAYRYQWTDLSLVEARERALELAKKAVSLDTGSPQIYWALGYVHVHRLEFDAAEAAAKQSVALSHNYADGHALQAYIANWRGKAIDAVASIQKAIKLNPYHTYEYSSILGLAYFTLGRYQDAITALKDALNRNDSALNSRLLLAASYTRLGMQDDAAWEIEQITANHPDVTLSTLETRFTFEDRRLLAPIQHDLRKAGLPQ